MPLMESILAVSSLRLSVNPPPKSRSPHLLLNVSIELFASSAVPPCLKIEMV
jgi:hypothetical protein